MRFEWDDEKAQENLRKHGIHFGWCKRFDQVRCECSIRDATTVRTGGSCSEPLAASRLWSYTLFAMGDTQSSQRETPIGGNGELSIRNAGRVSTLAGMSADEIDYSDIPELPDELLREAQPFVPEGHEWDLSVPVDRDVAAWFLSRDDGRDEAARALREYMERHRGSAA